LRYPVYPTTYHTTASKRYVGFMVRKNVRYEHEAPPPGSRIITIRV
jgi:hypothetical protein